ncbi:glycoside hydrolase family 16 protein [Nocardioides sp.]|uniref:glycoside hydrolase family 16 protein n=1 Tax=Nocardioides sp. TaxID=35761 RepID=UPI0031FE45C5|nr:glycoside hydrolase family 16 protein [Nocardioides sp.]
MKRVLVVVATLMISLLGNAAAQAADPVSTSRTRVPRLPTDACGTQPVKADGSRWLCSFDDEFNARTLDRTKWVPQTTGFSTGTAQVHACYVDDPANISVSGGSLNLTVRKLAQPVPCASNPSLTPSPYTSGSVSTYHLFSQQYGRFEARIKVAATRSPGLQETFWLWPDDRVTSAALWPTAGEIDVVESYSVYPDLGVPFLHYGATDNGGPVPGTNTAWNCVARRGVFNTWTLEWTPAQLKIMVNGRTCLVNTSGDTAFNKPYIAAFTQALGGAGNVYDGRTPMPATMNVDYLRVWK